MSKGKQKKMVFYRRILNEHKLKVKWLWVGEFGKLTKGKVRLVFAEDVMYPGRYEIIEASSGMGIIRHLKRLDELSFCRICDFVALSTEVKKKARKCVRVSRLPEITREEFYDEN